MIKRYLLLGMMCLSTLTLYPVAQSREVKRLRAAIESGDATEVALLLKKPGVLTQENRQELLDEAEQKVAYYEDNVSVWTSKKDTVRFLGGFTLGALGIGSAVFGIYESARKSAAYHRTHNWGHYDGEDEAPFIMGGFISSVLGLSLIKQGSQCLGVSELLKKSEDVFRLLEKASIKDAD